MNLKKKFKLLRRSFSYVYPSVFLPRGSKLIINKKILKKTQRSWVIKGIVTYVTL